MTFPRAPGNIAMGLSRDTGSKEKGCTSLVWFEYFEDLQDARACEWRMKKWKRAWKIRLIEEGNLEWADLYESLF